MTNDARAACALSAHNCKVVSARLDNDTPTSRITGRPKKLEHISVLISVTQICAQHHDVPSAANRIEFTTASLTTQVTTQPSSQYARRC